MATQTVERTIAYIAKGAIAANRFVQADATSDDHVKQATSKTAFSFGVSRYAAADGETIDVYTDGIVKVEASAAIVRGAQIASATDGRAVTAVATDVVMGVAEGAASAAGKFVRVRLAPVGTIKA